MFGFGLSKAGGPETRLSGAAAAIRGLAAKWPLRARTATYPGKKHTHRLAMVSAAGEKRRIRNHTAVGAIVEPFLRPPCWRR